MLWRRPLFKSASVWAPRQAESYHIRNSAPYCLQSRGKLLVPPPAFVFWSSCRSNNFRNLASFRRWGSQNIMVSAPTFGFFTGRVWIFQNPIPLGLQSHWKTIDINFDCRLLVKLRMNLTKSYNWSRFDSRAAQAIGSSPRFWFLFGTNLPVRDESSCSGWIFLFGINLLARDESSCSGWKFQNCESRLRFRARSSLWHKLWIQLYELWL